MLRELESEIQAYGAGRPHRARLKQLLRKKEIVGDLCDQLRTRLARCLYDELGNERVAPGVAPLLAPAVAPAAGGAGSSATSTNSTGELATLLEASSDEAVSSIDEPAGGVGGTGGEHSAQWLAEQLSGLLQARSATHQLAVVSSVKPDFMVELFSCSTSPSGAARIHRQGTTTQLGIAGDVAVG